MIIHKLLTSIILLLFFSSFAYAKITPSGIFKQYSTSVVTIVTLDKNGHPLSLGSGFFINEEGNVVTNHHLLEGGAKAIIKIAGGERGEIVEIINDDPKLDLLIARTTLKNTNPVPLGDSDMIAVGEEVIAIGNPAGLEGSVSSGIVSGVRKIEGFKLIQITAPISPGSSGGPVFNTMGQVIGIATSYLDVGQNLNFAMPVNYLKSLKPSKIQISSLPKMPLKTGIVEKGDTLVEASDIHYNCMRNLYDPIYNDLSSIDFAIRNQHNYPIKNIKLFFIYKNHKGEVISYSTEEIKNTILPKLGLQFSHYHHVNRFCRDLRSIIGGKDVGGKLEIRILDYEIEYIGKKSPSDLLSK